MWSWPHRRSLHAPRIAEIRHLTCEFHEGMLTLRGWVSSFYMKQLAQAALQGLSEVERVVNHLEVVRRW